MFRFGFESLAEAFPVRQVFGGSSRFQVRTAIGSCSISMRPRLDVAASGPELEPEPRRALQRVSKARSLDQPTPRDAASAFANSGQAVLQALGAMCHVWTAPGWQGKSSRCRLGRCSHVFGLFVRFT